MSIYNEISILEQTIDKELIEGLMLVIDVQDKRLQVQESIIQSQSELIKTQDYLLNNKSNKSDSYYDSDYDSDYDYLETSPDISKYC